MGGSCLVTTLASVTSLAAGGADHDVDDEHAAELTTRALRYSSFANELHAGARRWRDGTLG